MAKPNIHRVLKQYYSEDLKQDSLGGWFCSKWEVGEWDELINADDLTAIRMISQFLDDVKTLKKKVE